MESSNNDHALQALNSLKKLTDTPADDMDMDEEDVLSEDEND